MASFRSKALGGSPQNFGVDRSAGRACRRFGSDDEGSSTIEFVIWFPIMFTLLLVAAQGAILFIVQANYGSIARDTARMVARHAMTAAEASDYVASRATLIGGVPNAVITLQGGTVTVTLSKPALEVASLDVLDMTEGFDLSATITQSLEPR